MSSRIVSLVPSLSETIVELGPREALVGITKFCVEPPNLHRTAMIVGGTKDPDVAKIALLKPTHIITNAEENKPEHIESCKTIAPTLVTFPKSPGDVPAMLRDMGKFLGQEEPYTRLAMELRDSQRAFGIGSDGDLSRHPERSEGSRTYLYFIWTNPYMVVGPDTYISELLSLAGYRNLCQTLRYPEMTMEEIQRLRPDVIFFSTEPFPFRKRDAEAFRKAWPGSPPIMKIDGRLASWYGITTKTALDEIRKLLLHENNKLLLGVL
ncbi:MAG: helical backbone metal receptor [Oligoflexales bacterium]